VEPRSAAPLNASGRAPKRGRSPARLVALIAFFLSGASGLLCEMVWVRLLSLTFGHTVWAVSTVLVAFMAGLGAGSWFLGSLTERKGYDGLRTYATLQFGTAAAVLASPAALWCVDRLYLLLYRPDSPSGAFLIALRFVGSLAILLPPTFFMGGTLPALVTAFSADTDRARLSLPLLYGLNTLGAVVGCFGATFALLGSAGVHRTLWLAAGLNVFAGLAVFAAGRRTGGGQPLRTPQPSDREALRPRGFLLVALALSGFCALSYETLWARMIVYVVGVDVQAFGMMLGILLLGIGIGGAVCRVPKAWEAAVSALALTYAAIGALGGMTVPLFGASSWALVRFGLCEQLPVTATAGTKFVQCLLVLLPPSILMGASFPLAASLYCWGAEAAARDVGRGYAANTIGAVLGTVAAAFILIPLLGVRHSIFLTGALSLATALLCAMQLRPHARRRAAVAASACALVVVLCALLARGARRELFNAVSAKDFRTVYYNEGLSSTISVLVNRRDRRLMQLNSNGVPMAFTNHASRRMQKMLAHVPMLLHPHPRKALVIGLGSGTTAGAVRLHGVETDVVEIEAGQTEAARLFSKQNHGVMEDKKCRVIVEDGRTLLAATRRGYDVIIQTRMRPRCSQDLFSVEFYAACRAALRPRGVMCLVLPIDLCPSESAFRELIATFRTVFPYCALWYVGPRNVLLTGTFLPGRIDVGRWCARAARTPVREDLADVHVPGGLDLLAQLLAGPLVLKAYARAATPVHDERPIGFRWKSSHLPEAQVMQITNSLLAMAEPVSRFANLGPGDTRTTALARRENVRNLLMQARALLHVGSPVRAASLCAAALRRMPSHPEVRYQYARCQLARARNAFRLGQVDRAAALLRSAIKMNPAFTEAYVALGEALCVRGQYERAAEAFKRALQIAPEFDYARACLREIPQR